MRSSNIKTALNQTGAATRSGAQDGGTPGGNQEFGEGSLPDPKGGRQ